MRSLHVYDEGAGSHVLLRGAVRDLLREHGTPGMWSAADRGWWVRRERLPDVFAQAAEAGYAVKVHRDRELAR